MTAISVMFAPFADLPFVSMSTIANIVKFSWIIVKCVGKMSSILVAKSISYRLPKNFNQIFLVNSAIFHKNKIYIYIYIYKQVFVFWILVFWFVYLVSSVSGLVVSGAGQLVESRTAIHVMVELAAAAQMVM